MNESTFYSILRRLHKNNLTVIILKDVSNGPQRKYYKITPEGRVRLNNNIIEMSKTHGKNQGTASKEKAGQPNSSKTPQQTDAATKQRPKVNYTEI